MIISLQDIIFNRILPGAYLYLLIYYLPPYDLLVKGIGVFSFFLFGIGRSFAIWCFIVRYKGKSQMAHTFIFCFIKALNDDHSEPERLGEGAMYYALTNFTSAVFILVLYSNITMNLLVYVAQLVVGVATVVLMKRENRGFQGSELELIDKDQNVCSICLSNFDGSAFQLTCQHIFHRDCIEIWLREHEVCPYCRRQVRNEDERCSVNYFNQWMFKDVQQ